MVLLLWRKFSEGRGSPEVLADFIIFLIIIMNSKLTASIQWKHLLVKKFLLPLKERGTCPTIGAGNAIFPSYKLIRLDLADGMLKGLFLTLTESEITKRRQHLLYILYDLLSLFGMIAHYHELVHVHTGVLTIGQLIEIVGCLFEGTALLRRVLLHL